MGILSNELNRIHHEMANIAVKYFGEEEKTVDVVPVVRCKDCKFYRQEIDMCDEPYSTAHNVVHEDDFCSKAERKEHE